MHLLSRRDGLSVQCLKQFGNVADLRAVNALKSSSNVLMQLANIFTVSASRLLSRRSNAPRNHKDEIADASRQREALKTFPVPPDTFRCTYGSNHPL